MVHTSAALRRILSTYLRKMPLNVPNSSICSTSSGVCGMAILGKLIRPPIESRFFLQKPYQFMLKRTSPVQKSGKPKMIDRDGSHEISRTRTNRATFASYSCPTRNGTFSFSVDYTKLNAIRTRKTYPSSGSPWESGRSRTCARRITERDKRFT